ncbi:ATP synthase-coupling factor 6, mitochondrial-like [Gigantopelta aegis]|uniref:ATP synthase-coupling factor 6, mitochondrial-like n=1 Tax=Gigantopelta aegis TaxID=1735272 RepID=UPI001B888195|nr:ATP synthase-coupling factor 6, mitochondrial-like [Gigantopelta aegis]
MLTRLVSRLSIARHVVCQQAQRNIGVSAAAAQKMNLDPIQQLFVEKIRDYANKSKSIGGKLVDATPDVENILRDQLDKVNRVYAVKEGQDMTAFPTFNFSDVPLAPVGLGELKEVSEPVQAEAEEEMQDEDPANIPFYEV